MIGDLLSNLATAQKLSIEQIQKAVQDGTLPSYVGVPLLQQKMQQRQEAEALLAGQQQQKQPSVAHKIMQQADQLTQAPAAPQGIEQAVQQAPQQDDQQAPQQAPQQGIDAAQSNMPQQFAGGGIVAFADGGLSDDEDDTDDTDDTIEERMQQAQLDRLNSDMAARLQQGTESGYGIRAALPEAGYTGEGIKAPKGLEALRAHVLGKESGGKDYDAKGNPLTSPAGAKYAMQVMDATAQDPGFGIKPAQGINAGEYDRVGNQLLDALYGKYQDPKLTAMAYNWGSGNVDKWLKEGADIRKVPKETQKYIAGLFKGGKVKKYSGTDGISLVSPDIANWFSNKTSDLEGALQNVGKIKDYEQSLIQGKPAAPTQQDWNTFDAATNAWQQAQNAQAATNAANTAPSAADTSTAPAPAPAAAPAPSPEQTMQEKYLSLLQQREADTANQKGIDNYLALMQAGLGMMGGTSPYALANIGQGASSGITAKLNMDKARAAEEAATLRGYGSLYNTQQTAEYRNMLAGQNQEAQMRKQQFSTMANLEQRTRAQISSSLDKSTDPTFMNMSPEQKQAKIDQMTSQALGNLPAYKAAYKAYNGYDYVTAPTAPSVVDYSSMYGLSPKPKQ
jgi:hypothetical protein